MIPAANLTPDGRNDLWELAEEVMDLKVAGFQKYQDENPGSDSIDSAIHLERYLLEERAGEEVPDKVLRDVFNARRLGLQAISKRYSESDLGAEFNFAYAAHGLTRAIQEARRSRFDNSVVCYVAAGFALSRIARLRTTINREIERVQIPPFFVDYATYRIPLAWMHHHWAAGLDGGIIDSALTFAGKVKEQYGYSVAVLQEYVLILSEAIKLGHVHYEKSKEEIEDISNLFLTFTDEETISRPARVFKDQGDLAYMGSHRVASQEWYRRSFELYYQGYLLSEKHYYPGINAATLALITGDLDRSKEIANQVFVSCCDRRNENVKADEEAWLLLTMGEANLLLGKDSEAASYYKQALAGNQLSIGAAQSAYDQLCRVYCAVSANDPHAIAPVVEVFRKSDFSFRPGPVGNCGAEYVEDRLWTNETADWFDDTKVHQWQSKKKSRTMNAPLPHHYSDCDRNGEKLLAEYLYRLLGFPAPKAWFEEVQLIIMYEELKCLIGSCSKAQTELDARAVERTLTLNLFVLLLAAASEGNASRWIKSFDWTERGSRPILPGGQSREQQRTAIECLTRKLFPAISFLNRKSGGQRKYIIEDVTLIDGWVEIVLDFSCGLSPSEAGKGRRSLLEKVQRLDREAGNTYTAYLDFVVASGLTDNGRESRCALNILRHNSKDTQTRLEVRAC